MAVKKSIGLLESSRKREFPYKQNWSSDSKVLSIFNQMSTLVNDFRKFHGYATYRKLGVKSRPFIEAAPIGFTVAIQAALK